MITKQKIEIYKKYDGDIDRLIRIGQKKEKNLIKENDWSMIDSVLQDLELIKKGLCSLSYKDKLENIIKLNFEDEAAEIIKNMI